MGGSREREGWEGLVPLAHGGAPGCGGSVAAPDRRIETARIQLCLARGAVLGAATGEGLERRVCAAESA